MQAAIRLAEPLPAARRPALFMEPLARQLRIRRLHRHRIPQTGKPHSPCELFGCFDRAIARSGNATPDIVYVHSETMKHDFTGDGAMTVPPSKVKYRWNAQRQNLKRRISSPLNPAERFWGGPAAVVAGIPAGSPQGVLNGYGCIVGLLA